MTYYYLLVSVFIIGLSPFTPIKSEYADVVLNTISEKEGARPVVFPHWFHRIRFRCKVCHNELGFEMRVGANQVTMMQMAEGKFCGSCHNSEVAWGLQHCDRCHSGLPGSQTGLTGSHTSDGPGYW